MGLCCLLGRAVSQPTVEAVASPCRAPAAGPRPGRRWVGWMGRPKPAGLSIQPTVGRAESNRTDPPGQRHPSLAAL